MKKISLSNLVAEANNHARKGQPASAKVLIGAHNRYAVFAVHTRFDAVQWFVMDAEQEDPCGGGPATIRQCETLAEAIEGLTETPEEG